jgi:hypothetical protein
MLAISQHVLHAGPKHSEMKIANLLSRAFLTGAPASNRNRRA